MEKMNGKQYLKINNESFMPLSIEIIGKGIITPFGMGSLYSLCHYYEQMGDLMKDPEMCFIVVDNRQEQATAYEMVKIIPYLFQQDNAGLFEESVMFSDNKTTKYSPRMNADHAAFANLWLGNIKNQGFTKRFTHNS
jgi:hypothetical protein